MLQASRYRNKMARRTQHASKKPATAEGTPAELEALLGHRFKRRELLPLALTHRSFVYDVSTEENSTSVDERDLADPSRDNEQLEFVGDAALGLLVAEILCERLPLYREGELTRLRASVVSRKHLGEVGTQMELGRWMRLGHTAEKNEGRKNTALFANTVEAIIAALYLDGGIAAARRFVEEHVLAGALPAMVPEARTGSGDEGGQFSGAVGDHKSALQEMLQARGMGRPQYRMVRESGPDHRRLFLVEVRMDAEDKPLAEAEGSTKKQAQQEAARLAVKRLREDGFAIPHRGGEKGAAKAIAVSARSKHA